MIYRTVPSDYGPLSLRTSNEGDDDHRPLATELPKMQFAQADLVIKLGPKPQEWLLLHSDILSKTCSYFKASFSEQWEQGDSKPEMVFHPALGREVLMRCRALQCVDDTYMLGREDVPVNQIKATTRFSQSELATPGWPCPELRYTYACSDEKEAKRAIHVLFAMLYGAKIDICQLSGLRDRRESDTTREGFSTAIIACAYAEYWGCLETIKPCILAALQSSPGFWDTVRTSPETYLAFAIKLEDSHLYFSALRHTIRSAHESNDWKLVAKYTRLSITDLRAFNDQHLKSQYKKAASKLEKLTENLRKLQLQTTRAKYYGGGWHDAHTRLLDLLPYKDTDRSEVEKSFEAVDYLARAIYGEYIVYGLEGEFMEDSVRAWPAAGIARLVQDIEQAARSNDPSHLFDAAACVRFATMFNFSPAQRHQLHLRLRFLVREANDLIQAAFPPKTFQGTFAGRPTKYILNRAYLGDYHTYMAVPIHLPWRRRDNVAVLHDQNVLVPGIRTVDASPEWVSSLAERFGGETPEENDDQDGGEAEVEVEAEAGFEPAQINNDETVSW